MKNSWDKWTKYKIMKNTPDLISFLPDTGGMTKRRLWLFLRKYKKVMLKPFFGSMGSGVIKVSSLGSNTYEIHYKNKFNILKGKRKTYAFLKKKTSSRRYIVQRYIHLAKIDGNPFDFRVMIQRKKYSSSWELTGKLVRVARDGYIVTNMVKKILSVKPALKQSTIKNHVQNDLISIIDNISKKTAKRLGYFYRSSRIIGLDIGVDKKGRLWIIEANLKPQTILFRYLEDKKFYKRIISYEKGIVKSPPKVKK